MRWLLLSALAVGPTAAKVKIEASGSGLVGICCVKTNSHTGPSEVEMIEIYGNFVQTDEVVYVY